MNRRNEMDKERSNETPETEQKGLEEQNAADDLKFIRSTLEKTYRQIKPETHNTVMWGLICMASYIGIHFLIKFQFFTWIGPLYVSLMTFGLCFSFLTMYIVIKRQKKDGFFPLLLKQACCVCLIIMFTVIFWDRMGLFDKIFCGSGFIYAMAISMMLCILGIFHSKAWLFGGMLVFIGMLLAFIVKDYAFVTLGIATGLGFIIPAIIVQRNYNKQEKNYE